MNDELLILYYYDDGLDASERRRVAAALREDSALASRYAQLVRDLDAAAEMPPVRVPDGLAHRLETTVHRAARLERAAEPAAGHRLHGWSMLLGGAVTAALAVGIGLGLWMGGEGPGPAPVGVSQDPMVAWSQAAFERGVQAHFRSSRTSLSDWPNDEGAERAELIVDLLEQNRVYARLAAQNDAPDVARVLRSFEPILLKLANEDLSSGEVEALRSQLEFEMSVVLTKLARQSSERTEATTKDMTT